MHVKYILMATGSKKKKKLFSSGIKAVKDQMFNFSSK